VAFDNLSGVREAVDEVQERLSQNGRLLLRYSGTELLARVMIEGANQGEIETYAQLIAGEIRKEIGA
jgi:phosphoglucosamine mutase